MVEHESWSAQEVEHGHVSHGGNRKYLAVFVALCVLTAIVIAIITFNCPGKSCSPAHTVTAVPTIKERKIVT